MMTYADLYVVVTAVVVLVHCLQPATIIMGVGNQMHIKLAFNSAQQL